MASFLRHISQGAKDRVVIVDTTPFAVTAEANALTQFADCILLVIKFNSTSKNQLKDLVKKMGTEKIIGTVLNHVDQSSESFGGYKKYRKVYYWDASGKNSKQRSVYRSVHKKEQKLEEFWGRIGDDFHPPRFFTLVICRAS